ncbi:MAG: fumarate hydratase [Solobacterium sp.]|jgi:fumarate hydratase subunit alpha|nr:fumarate hydratase [Solobacterium sp.]MCH4206209.1 fumarate hydratase [Solobacterium sp.]MCH4227675.1 fumarate hydratase [Solobacterium sp.]MCH4283102.1 fumarate hydratase [Solobacterium sp.]
MKEINVERITEALKEACGTIAVDYQPDILAALKQGAEKETKERSQTAMQMLLENARIASADRIPICQDTGMAIVWLRVGQEVHFTGGSLQEAIQRGISEGYLENSLRASMVDDPLYQRKNTKNNTPAVIHMEIVEGDQVFLELMAKGFGSENKSAVKMLTPADGEKGVIDFVLDTVKKAGPNACPPFIIGVGIGGSFDSVTELSKHALMRPLSQSNPDPRYASLEAELLRQINDLHIGPMGFHGNTTALKVMIEEAPTHIAGLPAAVNMCCHACRHWAGIID